MGFKEAMKNAKELVGSKKKGGKTAPKGRGFANVKKSAMRKKGC